MRRVRAVGVCGLALLMMLAMAVVVAPGARAYGAATWQAAFAGTTALPCKVFPSVCASFTPPLPPTAILSNGFWGWCDFVGVSSGAAGDCRVSNYFHISIPSVSVFSVTCLFAIDVSGWTTGTSAMLPPSLAGLGIFITSGSLTLSPASPSCIAAAGAMGLAPGAFTASPGIDTGIPAAAGHFNTNQSIFTLPGQFQITVTQVA